VIIESRAKVEAHQFDFYQGRVGFDIRAAPQNAVRSTQHSVRFCVLRAEEVLRAG
jgi:hypothetical protein